MRKVGLLCLLLLFSCADPGLRDRSLMASLDDGRGGTGPLTGQRKKAGATSVIGLAPDPLAQYYPDRSDLILRFSDLGSLSREVVPQLRDLERVAPKLELPLGKPADLLRDVLGLPRMVTIDPVRPFAFVRVGRDWAALIPTRDVEMGGSRLKAIDAVYCVAGDPKVVAEYRAGFRKGFYLPGDCSITATPEAVEEMSATLARVARRAGVNLTAALQWLPPLPSDIERLDLALRLRKGGLRIDMRAAPSRNSPTGMFLERMRPATSAAARWLPPHGTLYVELVSPPSQWEGLVSVVLRESLARPTNEQAQILFSVRRLMAALGRDASAMLKLEPDGDGSITLVSHLDDPRQTQAFFSSFDLSQLLGHIAGPGGKLEWDVKAFERGGVAVGSIRGNISRKRLLTWRKSGNPILACMGVLMRGPVSCYAAVVEGKLCLVVGQTARSDIERMIDHLKQGGPVDNDHNVEVVSLFPQRIAAVSVDLAALFDGTRAAAPFWHKNGRALRDLQLRWRLPAALAITSEGGAFRAALRVRPAMLAEAIAKVSAKLDKKK